LAARQRRHDIAVLRWVLAWLLGLTAGYALSGGVKHQLSTTAELAGLAGDVRDADWWDHQWRRYARRPRIALALAATLLVGVVLLPYLIGATQ